MASFKLELKKLTEDLEDRPDPWFLAPKGWLKKPDFKRAAQEKRVIENPSSANIPSVDGKYGLRWFVLDPVKKRLTYYKNDDESSPELGFVDMNFISNIQPSRVYDAPEHSLDLMGQERYYTLVADSHVTLLRWGVAFQTVMTQGSKAVIAKTTSSEIQRATDWADRWYRYDVTYDDAGPLMVNVMGVANKDRHGKIRNNWVVVTSFQNYPDGTTGRSEATGLISVKDYIVGVNGKELTDMAFNDAMTTIISATWPKTLNFLRDNLACKERNKAEGWSHVLYPSLNRRRSRYIELRNDCIHFRKPAPGGSVSSNRDAFITLDSIVKIRPVIDKTLPVELQCMLQLLCKRGAYIDHVDADDVSIGRTPVTTVELCFTKQYHMNSWRSALASPSVADPSIAIHVLPIDVIEEDGSSETLRINQSAEGDNSSAYSMAAALVGVKNTLTNRFTPRELTLVDGCIRLRRPLEKRMSMGVDSDKSIFIANETELALHSIHAFYEPSDEFLFQIDLKTLDKSVVIGFSDEKTMIFWLDGIRETVAKFPGGLDDVDIPATISTSPREGDHLLDHDFAEATVDSDGITQGYLFKRIDNYASNLSIDSFRKRWFVLIDCHLNFYKSPSDVSQRTAFALGSIDLNSALEVREACDADAPENAIEIVTSSKSYLLVAEDEDEQLRWVDALSDALEHRSMSVIKDDHTHVVNPEAVTERRAAKEAAIVFNGTLLMKSLNRLTSEVTWKARHFIVANGGMSYYETFEDYFDEDKDCLGEISLFGMALIESSEDPSAPEGLAFDIHAHVIRGGDATGKRVFTLQAETEDSCLDWMNAICTANGTFALKEKESGTGLISFVDEEAVKRRLDVRRRTSYLYANEATINKVHAPGLHNAAQDSLEEEHELSEQEKQARLQAIERRGGVQVKGLLDLHGKTGGRGGRGAVRRPSDTMGMGTGEGDYPSAEEIQPASSTANRVQVGVKPSALMAGRGGGGRGGRGH